jgi:hypothetical protein
MKILVKKMSKFGILTAQMIFGAVVMIAAMACLPIALLTSEDPSLLLNPYILGVIIITMVIFGLFAYFLFIRPYFTYRKSPEVLMETDGEYVYIHGKKEAKIPLSDFEGAMVTYHLPFIYSKEFIAVLVTHLFSEKYGDLSLDIPKYGSYKLHFVSNVMETADTLTTFLRAEQQAPSNETFEW